MVALPSSSHRGVSLTLPLGFILLSSAMLLVALGLLAFNPQALQSYRHPMALAIVHLFLLGFGAGVLVGTLQQLLPVVLEVGLAQPRWGYAVMGLWGIGTPWQAWGFASQNPLYIAVGGSMVLLGMGLFAAQAWLTFRQTARWSPVATGLAWTALYLLLTPLLGLLQALSLRFGFYDPERLAWHALAGLVGVFLIPIVAVGHKLVGMFTLSHGSDERLLGLALWVLNLGLLGVALGQWMGGLLLGLGVVITLYDTRNLLLHRNKRALDIGVQHYLAGFGFLLLALGAWWLGHPWAGGLWFGLGFVGLMVSGMLYKITPFLVWTHRYAPQIGRAKVPLLKEMLPEGIGRNAGVLWGTGALLLPFFALAVWLLWLGAWLFAYALVEVIRR